MRVCFDIETDGLKPTLTWCMCIIDIDTEEEYFFGPNRIKEGLELLSKADLLVGHNIILFDLKVLRKLYKLKHTDRIIDTLILSKLYKSTLPSHSLAAWGKVFGQYKQEHEDWSQYSEGMKSRCISDTRLNLRLFRYFYDQRNRVNKEASELEHFIAKAVEEMTSYGFLFNTIEASKLLTKIRKEQRQLTFDLEKEFPSLPKKGISYVKIPKDKLDKQIKYTKEGTVSGSITRGFNSNQVIGEFTKVTWRDQNFSSNQFLIDHLLRLGWEPDEFTETGQPKLGEEQMERLADSGISQGVKLSRWSMLTRRIAQIESWIEAVDSNNRIHANVRSPGTWTYRMTHSDPNMSAVPALDKPFGAECRSLFCVPEGKKLLGCDASGIQLRVLANLMGDTDYAKEVVTGDIHTLHKEAAELSTRDQAKTFIYAFLLGAGNQKIGQIAGEPPDKQSLRGKHLREVFLKRVPALKDLIDKLKSEVASREYIIGLDGRRVYCPDPHYALAGALQNDESVIMKKAYEFWSKDACNLDWHMVQWSHDEWQTEVLSSHAEELGKLQAGSFKKVQSFYDTIVELDGEYKIGDNWKDTH